MKKWYKVQLKTKNLECLEQPLKRHQTRRIPKCAKKERWRFQESQKV